MGSGLRCAWSENSRTGHKKHRISNGNRDFLVLLFTCLSFPLFLFYSGASMLFYFEHVSGSGLFSDWNRCCAWIVVALFWCDWDRVCECVQRFLVKVNLLPLCSLFLEINALEGRGAVQATLLDREQTQLWTVATGNYSVLFSLEVMATVSFFPSFFFFLLNLGCSCVFGLQQ